MGIHTGDADRRSPPAKLIGRTHLGRLEDNALQIPLLLRTDLRRRLARSKEHSGNIDMLPQHRYNSAGAEERQILA